MIEYQMNSMDNGYTEGFETTQTAPLTLAVAMGSISFIQSKRVMNDEGEFETVKEVETYAYDGFELDIVPDAELSVVYDIYLLEAENADGSKIHVDRTEMIYGEAPYYSGETPMVHTLASISVPAATTDLALVPIQIRLVELNASQG